VEILYIISILIALVWERLNIFLVRGGTNLTITNTPLDPPKLLTALLPACIDKVMVSAGLWD